MKADRRFIAQTQDFWAHIRTISQVIGYTDRKTSIIRVLTLAEVCEKLRRAGFGCTRIACENGSATPFGQMVLDYFSYRAEVLNGAVQNLLMDKKAAQMEFKRLKSALKPTCPLPLNKQKGKKRDHAFLTGIVNMLFEANLQGASCDYDPRGLTTITAQDGSPLRTLSRRVDGAFPSIIDPVGIWEIKEYYNTTTFGSRVADGVYETLLDGLELEELRSATSRKVQHLLILDDRFTWWECGRSYLCRIVDMLHMGLVDEVLFGKEVLTRLPEIAREWKAQQESKRYSSR